MRLRMVGTWLCWLAAAGACAAAPARLVRISINGYLGRVTALTVIAPGKSRAVEAASRAVLAEAGAGTRWTIAPAGGPERRLRCTWGVGGSERKVEARALRIEAAEGETLRVIVGKAERIYPGVIEIQTGTAGWTIINEAPLEQYLQGVIATEVSERWHPEALKALTVAARSYTERNRGRHGPLFDLCDTTHCHCYAGIGQAGERIRSAVAATAGLVALYEGRPIDAVYSADCGGRTQTVQDAWGSRREIGYLRSVVDAPAGGGPEHCSINPKHSWSLTLSPLELARRLNGSPHTRVGTVKRVEAVGTNASGRPALIEVLGGDVEVPPLTDRLPCEVAEEAASARAPRQSPAGSAPVIRQIPMSQFRQLLGEAAARGSMLQIHPTREGGLLVEGKGLGHGVGLCQYGAQGMAARYAKTWEEILHHYYADITLGPIP